MGQGDFDDLVASLVKQAEAKRATGDPENVIPESPKALARALCEEGWLVAHLDTEKSPRVDYRQSATPARSTLTVGFPKKIVAWIAGVFLAVMVCVVALMTVVHIGYYIEVSIGVKAGLLSMVVLAAAASLYACAVVAASRRVCEVAAGTVTVRWKPIPVRTHRAPIADITELSVHTHSQRTKGHGIGFWKAHDLRARTRAGKRIDLIMRVRARDMRLLVPLVEKILAQWGSHPEIKR